jgi:PmbA protein
MEYAAFKDELFTRAVSNGFTDCELFYTSSASFSVKIFKGEIDEYKNTDSAGASFRGTYNGRVGYAFTEKLDDSVIKSLVDNAAANAGVIEEKEIEKLYPGDKDYPKVDNYSEALASVEAARKIEQALAMEKYAYSLDPRVKSIDYCVLGTDESETRIANSYGLDVSNNDNMAFAWIGARVEEDGVTKNGYDFWVGQDFDKFDYKALAETAVQRGISLLGAKSVESGAYPVIFNNEAAASMFATFAGIFYAENGQKGFSLLTKDRLGQQIASPAVTLRDDCLTDLAYVSIPFDSEGVSGKNKAVIEGGTLATLLYNTKSAEKDGVQPTGNGFKGSFKGSVGTSVTNFYIVPSDKTPDDLMKEAGRGLLLTDLAGLHSGANQVSGDFSLSAEGFLFEDGKQVRPVEQITVAGNFYDMLKNVTAVGSDLRFNPPGGSGSIGMPSVLVSGLQVSGL